MQKNKTEYLQGIMLEGVKKVINLAGSQRRLAAICQAHNPNIKQCTVSQWLNRDKKVPGDYVIFICNHFKDMVFPYELRPDLFPKED